MSEFEEALPGEVSRILLKLANGKPEQQAIIIGDELAHAYWLGFGDAVLA